MQYVLPLPHATQTHMPESAMTYVPQCRIHTHKTCVDCIYFHSHVGHVRSTLSPQYSLRRQTHTCTPPPLLTICNLLENRASKTQIPLPFFSPHNVATCWHSKKSFTVANPVRSVHRGARPFLLYLLSSMYVVLNTLTQLSHGSTTTHLPVYRSTIEPRGARVAGMPACDATVLAVAVVAQSPKARPSEEPYAAQWSPLQVNPSLLY